MNKLSVSFTTQTFPQFTAVSPLQANEKEQ